jgi:hypothetical protein
MTQSGRPPTWGVCHMCFPQERRNQKNIIAIERSTAVDSLFLISAATSPSWDRPSEKDKKIYRRIPGLLDFALFESCQFETIGKFFRVFGRGPIDRNIRLGLGLKDSA